MPEAIFYTSGAQDQMRKISFLDDSTVCNVIFNVP